MSIVVDPILENNTWATISEVAKSGKAPQFWSIGDSKKVIYDKMVYNAIIIGFDHDFVADGEAYGRSKSGITFQLGTPNDVKNCGLSDVVFMNETNTNAGGWSSSSARAALKEFEAKFTPIVQDKIVAVKKLTSVGSSGKKITITTDKLFLLSEVEAFGKATRSYPGEGKIYKFYENNPTSDYKIRYLRADPSLPNYSYADPRAWWLRSPRSSNSAKFCMVNNGAINAADAGASYAVTFGFCV